MIVGGVRLLDPDTSYDQSNDMVEGLLLKLGYEHPLQSCGPNAAGSAMEAVGYRFDKGPLATVSPSGEYTLPADDLMTEWFNNPRNYRLMEAKGINPRIEPNHRHARLYPLCVWTLWRIRAEWLDGFALTDAVRHLRKGRALQICLRPPGHYVALVGYDEATMEYIANDSWTRRKRVPVLPPRGFNFRMTAEEEKAVVAEAVLYYGPEDKGD